MDDQVVSMGSRLSTHSAGDILVNNAATTHFVAMTPRWHERGVLGR